MIDDFQRERNYIQQEVIRTSDEDSPVRPLTPRQRRRIKHKKNHQAAQWVRGSVPTQPKPKRDVVDYGAIASQLASVGRRWGKSRKERALDAKLAEASKSPLDNDVPPEPGSKPICPTCSAVADERCRTGEGKPTRRHKNRP